MQVNQCEEHQNKTVYVILITFYSPSCLGQETAKETFGLRVKLPPAHPVYHTRWRLHTVPLIAERQAGKLWIPIFIVFGLTQPGIEPESNASVANALSLDHWSANRTEAQKYSSRNVQ